MLEHRWTLARRRKRGFSHRMPALQERPDFRRQSDLLQAPCQAPCHPSRALPGSAARNRNQHHAAPELSAKALVTDPFQPDAGSEIGQPGLVHSLQSCTKQPAFLANTPGPARQICEARSEWHSRQRGIRAAPPFPRVFIRKSRRRVPACRAPARPLSHRARHRDPVRSPPRDDFPPPLPAGVAMP